MALPDLQGALWAWVQGLPPWQSDLLRRLAILDEVKEDDLVHATRTVLGSFGITDSSEPAAAPIPIPALVTASTAVVTKIVTLRDFVAVGSVEPGQRLEFAPVGLTVVFGETGSGKSSYARVLRKACRSSAKPVEILPNVFKSGPGVSQSRGTAQIDILKAGAPAVIQRDVNGFPEPDLAQISVFDSDCATVYADEESEITYTPASLRLLERLVSFQAQIKKRIDENISRLEMQQVPTDGFDVNTRAGALVTHLSENVNPQTVAALAAVSIEEKQRLDSLRQQVAAATAIDPLKTAEALKRKADGAERLTLLLGELARGLDQSVVSDLLTLNASAARLAAQSEQLSSALSEASARPVGGQAWKSLWHAAHAYVTDMGESFPPAFDDAGAICPLCQQSLAGAAVDRLRRFEEFFRGEVATQIREVARKREAAVSGIGKLQSVEEHLLTQSPLVFAGEAIVEQAVVAFVRSAALRRAAIHESAASENIVAPLLAPNPIDSVTQWIAGLRRQVVEQTALAVPDGVAKARREIAELENRILLEKRLTAVLDRIEALKRIASLRRASAALSTTGLSRKIGDFTDSAVTAQLRERLAKELDALQCGHLPVSVGARGAKGKTRVSVRLDATRNVDVSDVLSEGEKRALALSFFLAEVSASEHGGGVVLDDPVSSLDHARRSYVAQRLVEEAGRRQTIVFTHDIVLLLELQEYAEQEAVPCEMRVVRRVGTSAGVASKDLPWIALNVSKRIGYLKNELQKLGALERKGDADAYRHHVKTWFELLREAWERAVEEKLFNGVVGRFQPGIKTLSLAGVSVTPTLTSAVEQGMTLASKWAHDQAPALNRPPPKSAELQTAMDNLEAFVAQFKK